MRIFLVVLHVRTPPSRNAALKLFVEAPFTRQRFAARIVVCKLETALEHTCLIFESSGKKEYER